MAPLTYAAPGYGLGDSDQAAKSKAAASLKKMQKSLTRWLGYRSAMNKAAEKLPPAAVAKLKQDRFATEQALANNLHALLIEMGACGTAIPAADVSCDPDAAAKLAEVAIAGKTPGEVSSPQATGIFWWLIAIPVAGVVLVISQWIKSKADLAMEQEKTRCIQSGACTDEGFWLKWGAIAVIGWLAWDKFGLREAVRRKGPA
jgi:hypothetical protein